MPAYIKGAEKIKKYCISCRKNTKFLHTIAEDFLYLMHKKWKSYMYLERDTTIGNFEAGISKFVIARHPLQFTQCAKIFTALPLKINRYFYFQ
jgi:hypothetical protein